MLILNGFNRQLAGNFTGFMPPQPISDNVNSVRAKPLRLALDHHQVIFIEFPLQAYIGQTGNLPANICRPLARDRQPHRFPHRLYRGQTGIGIDLCLIL